MANTKQAAAYPPKIRRRMYFLIEHAGRTVSEICNLYFISKKTYYKWRAVDQDAREHIPKKEPPQKKIKGEIRLCIEKKKLRLNYGPKKMKLLIKRRFNIVISATAIYKFYLKRGLVRKPQKKLS